jgi:hypothetical protein
MVTDAIGVPALDRQLLQGFIVDYPLPSALVADQEPVTLAELLRLADAQLTELTQRVFGVEDPIAAASGLAHTQLFEDGLQGEQLVLVTGSPKPKPAEQN